MSTTLPDRKDVPLEERWNLESIFPDTGAWQQAFQDVESRFSQAASFRGRLGESPQTLLQALKTIEQLAIDSLKVLVYAGLSASVDVGDQQAAAMAGQARGLMARLQATIAYLEPELMSIGFDTLFAWAEAHEDLAVYRHHFDRLKRMQPHIRSGEVEELLALVSEPLPPSVLPAYAALTNADLKFKPAISTTGEELEIGQSSIGALITHPDREVRRTAWEHYADAYLEHKNTLAAIQIQALQRDVFRMRARGFESSLQASLYPNNIPEEVFHNLIEVFKKNLPTWHRYWRVRRQALGLDTLHVYDIKAPLTQEKPYVPYEQAVEWIAEGMAPLGEEYVSILRKGCTEYRWVDRARNRGKRQGAFSSGTYGTQPFIMMSYADDLFSLSTLAHELGHSMHSYFTHKTQPFVYADYSLFVAEVASNFNQAMVRHHLLQTQSDPAFQLALLEEAMSNYHRYFFIMPTLARWELEMHRRVEQGKPVNAQIMIDLAADLFKEGYGDEVAYDHERIGITWAQFSHMYMNFYVYQYATGISAANALARDVLEGRPGAAENYIAFLKAGSSMYPLDVLKMAGVDMTSPEPVETAFGVLADYVERIAQLTA